MHDSVLAAPHVDDPTPKIVKRYRQRAETVKDKFRCASCAGVEIARYNYYGPIREIETHFNEHEPPVRPAFISLLRTHLALLPRFGDASEEEYLVGVAPGLQGGLLEEDAEEVETRHAHAVISRASLENGMRVGLLEYGLFVVTKAPDVTIRPWNQIQGEFVTGDAPNALNAERTFFRDNLNELNGLKDEVLATRLRARLIDALVTISLADHGSASERRNQLLALSACYRAAALNFARLVTRESRRDGGYPVFATTAWAEIIWGNTRNRTTLPIRGSSFAGDLRKYTDGISTAINDVALNWATVSEVEISKQCAVCETEQGDGDMPARFDGAVAKYRLGGQVLRANPFVGVGYHKLSFTPGNTVWDLSNGIVVVALRLVFQEMTRLSRQLAQGNPRGSFLDAVMTLFMAAPHLTTLYFQALFLEVGLATERTKPLRKVLT